MHDDRLVIRNAGLAAMVFGVGSERREIPLAALSGVVLSPASTAGKGWLRLEVGGHSPADEVAADPNAVYFRRWFSAEFEELAGLLKDRIAKNVATGIDPSTIEVDPGLPRPWYGARPAPEPGSVEYLVNAAYWTIGLSILMPLLALPAWGFAFLVVVRGRRNAGLWLFFLSAFIATASAVGWAAIFGA